MGGARAWAWVAGWMMGFAAAVAVAGGEDGTGAETRDRTGTLSAAPGTAGAWDGHRPDVSARGLGWGWGTTGGRDWHWG